MTSGTTTCTTFDICGPLPTGTTLLEASAGTGKTLDDRGAGDPHLAEGDVTLDEMLVVTFTRAASQELRERVRRQLDEAVQLLGDPGLPSRTTGCTSGCSRRRPSRADARLDRLTQALVSFDAATIATIHQFCQLVLRSLGVAGDTDAGATLVEDLEQLTTETVDDRYLARFGSEPTAGLDPRRGARPGARGRRRPPRARRAGGGARRRGLRRPRCGSRSPARCSTRSTGASAAWAILSYDDLLSQLADALEGADAAARRRMQHRWKFVLIDEFQDTDPVQWQVFRARLPRRSPPWCSSATPSRPSTPSAAATS